MIIDSHQHFWKYHPQRDTWITDQMSVLRRDFLPVDLLAELQSNHIDGTIAVQADQYEAETAFLLDLAEQYPFIKGVVGWIDLAAPNVSERLAHFSQFPKLRGFRHIVQSEPDDRYLLREDFCRGIAALHDFHFTYDILVYPKQLPAAVEFASKFPDQIFVLDHLAKPFIKTRQFDSWTAHIRELAQNSNVSCKLSGLITEADWRGWRVNDFRYCLDVVSECFGPERLMFGSDWPVCLLAGTYRQARSLIESYMGQLPADAQASIWGMNAIRFYGLRES